MNRAGWIAMTAILAATAYWTAKYFEKKTATGNQSAITQTESASYWTCPMHPQIHSSKPGECPICHMKLVQVKAQGDHTVHTENAEDRAMVSPTPEQRRNLGIQKVAVERMDLTARIPISGRLVSPSAVDFQVYESDIRYLKPGLAFRGESGFKPEGEISGKISSIDNLVDPVSRTIRVIGRIERGAKGLISETTFSGSVEIVLRAVIAIPESSVLHTGSGDFVYVIHEDESLMAVPVKLGQKAESFYEVIEGLSPGEFISSGPNFLIDSEAKIRGAGGGASGHSHN